MPWNWWYNELNFCLSSACWYNDDKIIECGVQLLTEEAESSRNNKVDKFETESTKVFIQVVRFCPGKKIEFPLHYGYLLLFVYLEWSKSPLLVHSLLSSSSSSWTPEAQKKAGIKSKADSSVARNYNAYLSFHDPDLPREFLNHIHYHFASKVMTFFNDQGIERGETIGPEFVEAIRESQVSIVVVSLNYASSVEHTNHPHHLPHSSLFHHNQSFMFV